MTCDHAIEILPWLLNGTLEAGERNEIWQHLESCEGCRRSLTETREAWSVFAQHLPSQDLVALAWGEAPSEAVAEHLASCASCAAELELARISRRLEEEGNVVLFPAARPRPAAVPRRWQAAAVAASLLAVVMASGWFRADRQADELSTRLARIEAPQPAAPAGEVSLRERLARLEGEMKRMLGVNQENEKQLRVAQEQVAKLEEDRRIFARPQATALFDLGSGDVMRSETTETTTIEGDQHVTLLLSTSGYRESGPPRAEITDSAGKVVQVNSLPMTQEGYVSIALSPGFLAPGRYTLRLSGLPNHRWAFEVLP